MALSPRVHDLKPNQFVDWRARQISDPIEKLQYLHCAMTGRNVPVKRPVWRRLSLVAFVIVAVSLLLPAAGVAFEVSGFPPRQKVPPDAEKLPPQIFSAGLLREVT